MVKNKTKLAFTLIELILTIILVSILSITIIPKFFSVVVFSQSLFTKQVLNVVSYAQTLAIGSGCHISVSVTATTVVLNLRSACTTGTFTNIVYDPANVSNSFIKTAPKDVTIASTNFPIYFNSNGQALSVASGSAVNASLNINGAIINITGATGMISG